MVCRFTLCAYAHPCTLLACVFDRVQHHFQEVFADRSYPTVKEDPKRVYYLSLEFLMGRSLLNALMNLDLDKPYAEALQELGYKMEVSPLLCINILSTSSDLCPMYAHVLSVRLLRDLFGALMSVIWLVFWCESWTDASDSLRLPLMNIVPDVLSSPCRT